MPRGAKNRSPPRAGCVLVDPSSKILTVHNVGSDMWGFPKGRAKTDELSIETALRELKEETGKVLSAGVFTDSFGSRGSRLYFARGDFDHNCVVDGWEIDRYEWLTLDELRSRKISNFTRSFLSRIELAIANSGQNN